MKKIFRSLNDVLRKLKYVLSTEQKKYGFVVLCASFIGAVLETFGVSAIIPLINALLTPEDLLQQGIIGEVLKGIGVTQKNEIIIAVGGGTIILYIVKNVYFIFLTWLKVKYSCKVRRELSAKMMTSYMEKGYHFFLKSNTSKLLRGVSDDTTGVYSLLNHMLKGIVECMTVCLICVYIFVTDWVMAVVMVGLAGLCLSIIYSFFRKRMGKQGTQSRTYGALVNQQAIQIFQGIKEVIVMRKQNFFTRKFEENSVKQQQTFIGQLVGVESPMYIIEAICITGLLGIICIRVSMGSENATTMLPALSAFAVGAFRILPALGKISNSFNNIIFYMPSLNDMYVQFHEVIQKNDSNNLCEEYTGIRGFENELKLQQVSWKYDANENNILENINLTIKKGESVALIGQSGAGKTTLADIMLGLLKPQEGKVTIDGMDIFKIGKEWNSIMGYVPQTVYITDDTIRNNIAFGIPEKEINDEKIWKALEQAQLKDFVQSLDKQLDTMVGERGMRFSGGQRQRLAIARALYEEPDILILDEATAALDNDTESAVMEAIENLQGKITLIIVAHRLTTIRKCDKIYEVKDGNLWRREKEEVFAINDVEKK